MPAGEGKGNYGSIEAFRDDLMWASIERFILLPWTVRYPTICISGQSLTI